MERLIEGKSTPRKTPYFLQLYCRTLQKEYATNVEFLTYAQLAKLFA